MKGKIHLIAALAGIFYHGVSISATDDFLIQHFEPSQPSFGYTVNAIRQDSMGFIWFGTDNGLYRYDGYELLPVEFPRVRPGYRRIRSICEDASGDLWVGTNGGLFHYAQENGATEPYRESDPVFSSVAKVLSLPSGLLALGVRNHGAWILDPVSRECKRIELEGGTPDETVSICLGEGGMLYILSPERGLFRLDSAHSLVAESVPGFAETPLQGLVLFNIEYYNHRIIAGVAERTYLMDLRNGKVSTRNWSVVNALVPRPEGGFFLASNRGFIEVAEDFTEKRVWDEDFSDKYALHDNAVRAMCMDREGNVWLGTRYGGAYLLAKNYADLTRFYPLSGDNSFGRRIREIVEDDDEVLWIGSENSGLIRFELSSGNASRVSLPLQTQNILGLCIDGPYLWIGSYSRTDPTLRLDRRTMKVETFPDLPNCLYYIFKGGDQMLFMADDNALYYYDTAKDSLGRLDSISPAGFQYVAGIPGVGGDVWMGGTGAMLYRYNNGSFTPVTDIISGDEKNNPLYAERNISPRLVDRRARLWFTIRDMGLYRLNPSDGQVLHYAFPFERGLSVVHRVIEDREGTVWLVSGTSLVTLNPDNGKYFSYGKEDGLLSGEFNEASGLLASDGKIYLGLLDGMIAFDPVKFRRYPFETHHPVFTGFDLVHSIGKESETDAIAFPSGTTESKISLKASQNAFVVKVSEMNYSIPHRTHLVYSMDGGSHWKEVDDGRIEASRLSPGKYVLKVRSIMSDGSLDDKESSLEVTIKEPLLVRLPFILLYILLMAFILAAVSITVRKRSLRKALEKARLDSEVREAERQKQLYASKVDFLMDLAHQIRNPLALIKAPVEFLRLRLGRSADATIVKEIDTVSRNADKLSGMLEEFLDVHGRDNYIKQHAGGLGNRDLEENTTPRIIIPGMSKALLIIERDPEMRNFLCRRFEDAYNVYLADNLETANGILRGTLPDIIICDLDAGDGELYSFCAALKSRKDTAAIPLVVLSDLQEQDARIDALEKGAEAYFAKPFSIAELLGATRSLLLNRERVKEACAGGTTATADKDFLPNLQSIMASHLADENLDVDMLAELSCMSTSSLFKKLKTATGMSPGEFIVISRMKEAAALMKNTALSINDISVRVGFHSLSYFSTCFKNHFGISPKKYRQSLGKD